MKLFYTLPRARNRLPGLNSLGYFALLVGMFLLFYAMLALSMQRSNQSSVVMLTPESSFDLSNAF